MDAVFLVMIKIIGKNLYLSTFLIQDISDDYIGWLNDSDVVRYSNQRFTFHTTETCLQYVNGFENSKNYLFGIHLLENNRLIGTMTAYYSCPHNVFDMGLMLGDRSMWGKGVGKEAWTTLLNWLLQEKGARKVTGGALKCNRAMVGIMENSGMQLEGVRAMHELVGNRYEDILYYAKFNCP